VWKIERSQEDIGYLFILEQNKFFNKRQNATCRNGIRICFWTDCVRQVYGVIQIYNYTYNKRMNIGHSCKRRNVDLLIIAINEKRNVEK